MRRRFLAAAINGIKCFLRLIEVIVLRKTADMIAAAAARMQASKIEPLEKTSVLDAYPVKDMRADRKITTKTEETILLANPAMAKADKTIQVVAGRGLEGYFRAELKHFHTLLFSRVAGLLSAAASVMQRTELFRIILTANAAAYDAVQMARSAAIQFGSTVGANIADAVQMAADKAVQIDRTAEPTSADVASAGAEKSIPVNNVAGLSCNVIILADKMITTETVAELTVQGNSWYEPVESNEDLYIRSVYAAVESGSDLYLGGGWRTPVTSDSDLYITSVYHVVAANSDLYITNKKEE